MSGVHSNDNAVDDDDDDNNDVAANGHDEDAGSSGSGSGGHPPFILRKCFCDFAFLPYYIFRAKVNMPTDFCCWHQWCCSFCM